MTPYAKRMERERTRLWADGKIAGFQGKDFHGEIRLILVDGVIKRLTTEEIHMPPSSGENQAVRISS